MIYLTNKIIRVGDFPIGDEERKAINDVLDSGKISEGKYTKQFELDFAKKNGNKYCVVTSSGTAALIVGLLSLIHSGKIKKGSKVITTPLTFISTVNAIVLAGLEPVFVDIADDGLNISADNIEKLLSESDPKEFSLILPVHLMGYPCDMVRINEIAQKYDLLVFEDAAQAHGTTINGKNTGSFSVMTEYSFYIAHNIQVGEMGAITTDDLELAKLARQLKANGRVCDCVVCTRDTFCPHEPDNDLDMDPRFTHKYITYNFKTMDFQAALGVLQITRMDDIIKKRQENVRKISSVLNKHSDVLELPKFSEDVSYLAYPIIIKDRTTLNPSETSGSGSISRLNLRKKLNDKGIESRPLFGCIPTQQPAYEYLKKEYEGKLPNAEYVGTNGFYIGCHQFIDDDDIERIGKAFDEILA